VREAIVHDRPFVADALERGVDARDLGIPLESDLVRRAAADRQPVRRGPEVDEDLVARVGAVDEEGRSPALGGETRAQLLRARGVGIQGRGHGTEPRSGGRSAKPHPGWIEPPPGISRTDPRGRAFSERQINPPPPRPSAAGA
jgi:hypothetical protein